jgi:hypothetical protein
MESRVNEVHDIALFLEQVRVDPRIGPPHISLYLAIFYCWLRQGGNGAVEFTGKELMQIAKIAGGTPFYRCIKQLDEYGYIRYEPSFNPAVKSRAFMVGSKVGKK